MPTVYIDSVDLVYAPGTRPFANGIVPFTATITIRAHERNHEYIIVIYFTKDTTKENFYQPVSNTLQYHRYITRGYDELSNYLKMFESETASTIRTSSKRVHVLAWSSGKVTFSMRIV